MACLSTNGCDSDLFPAPCATCGQNSKNRKSCAVCAAVIGMHSCGYWGVGPDKVDLHVACGEGMISVFKILAVGQGSFYYDQEAPPLTDLMDGAEFGDGYTITKEEMTALEYYNLPEFAGF